MVIEAEKGENPRGRGVERVMWKTEERVAWKLKKKWERELVKGESLFIWQCMEWFGAGSKTVCLIFFSFWNLICKLLYICSNFPLHLHVCRICLANWSNTMGYAFYCSMFTRSLAFQINNWNVAFSYFVLVAIRPTSPSCILHYNSLNGAIPDSNEMLHEGGQDRY